MTAYRQNACLFCDAPSVEACPRCRADVCAHHRAAVASRMPGSWCAVCAKELKDDLDVARFAVDVSEVPPDSGALFRSRRSGLIDLVDGLVGGLRRYFSERRVRRAFEFRGRAVGPERGPYRAHAALWFSSGRAACGDVSGRGVFHAARTERLGRSWRHCRPLGR